VNPQRRSGLSPHIVITGATLMFKLIRNLFLLRQAWKLIKRRR
jgi:hypothetical protein